MQRLHIVPTSKRQAGTSLVELLVVMVVFLVGILAIVQIFPGGFRILSLTRSEAVASQLARAEIERLAGQKEQLPEMIVPVVYVDLGGGMFAIEPDPNRNSLDLSPSTGNTFDVSGNLIDPANNPIANWKYLTGPNVLRRVIGEGRRVPSPNVVNGVMGSRMTLNFGPVLFDPRYQNDFIVYGNDMAPQYGVPGPSGVLDYQFYLNNADHANGTITLPSGPAQRSYRLTFTWTEVKAGQIIQKERLGQIIVVAANQPNGYQTFSFANIVDPEPTVDGATYAGVLPDSVRSARVFEDVTTTGFSPNGTKPIADPYEYMLPQDGANVKDSLGMVLFNPAGYNYQETFENGRRVPLVARVDYDVYDWRVLKEDFRIPDTVPANYTLPVGNLKVQGGADVDGTTFNGMGFNVPNGPGGYVPGKDFVLMDVQTGGVYLYDPTNPADPTPPAGPVNDFAVDPTKSSYTVDKSRGVVKFNDFDRNPANGLQLRLLYPDGTVGTVDAANRAVRALFMARNEWAVQVFKAAEQYHTTYLLPTTDTFYVGSSAAAYGLPAVAGENPALSPHRIYFPEAEDGRKVVVDTIWFDWTDGSGTHTDALQAQAFTIGRDRGTPDFDPYIDIAQAASDYVAASYGSVPTSVAFDFAKYGYAVRGVKGASVNVRVFWNPQTFALTPSSATNFQNFDRFAQAYRHQSTESFLTREPQ